MGKQQNGGKYFFYQSFWICLPSSKIGTIEMWDSGITATTNKAFSPSIKNSFMMTRLLGQGLSKF